MRRHGDELGAILDQLVEVIDDAHAAGLHIPIPTAQWVAGLRMTALVLSGQTPDQELPAETRTALANLREQFGHKA